MMTWIRVDQWEIVLEAEPTGLTGGTLLSMIHSSCQERAFLSNSDLVIRSARVSHGEG